MNALTRTAATLIPRTVQRTTTRRFGASATREEILNRTAEGNFKQNWMLEPGTYPIAIIIGFACGFCAFTCTSCLMRNPDCRIVPSKRTAVIRSWD
mmetsp:Transcript_4494/g.5734  ORF Transcript_4494/g.5734 Transcript_4494/m.5734 type:complete len:96 (-) Transcript_4494:132-419(-)